MTDAAHEPTRGARPAAPFPWGRLDVVRADDASAVRALGRWGASLARAQEIAPALSSLLGARVELRVRSVRGGARAARGGEDGIAVIVAASDAPEIGRAVLVEVETALAAALTARALRRAGPRMIAPGAGSGTAAGALAAVVAATVRRAHAGRALRVIGAGPASGLEGDLKRASPEVIEAHVTVLLDDDAYAARILVPRDLAMAAGDPPLTRSALAALGDVPLSLPIVAAVSGSTATEIGSLRRGDAWVPGFQGLTRTPAGGIAGPVLLAAPAHEVGLRATLGEDGRLVLGDGIEALSWAVSSANDARENAMSGRSDTIKDALVTAVGEVPVVVRVEIGTAEMRAREWAALGAGDVVALGSKIGEGVTLRVGGVAVARGELVDLDGEVGVRILARTEER